VLWNSSLDALGQHLDDMAAEHRGRPQQRNTAEEHSRGTGRQTAR
jgi:hypothetical protein